MLQFFGRFRRNIKGTTAIIFGLAMVPVMGLVGAAVDYGRSLSARTYLQSAADAGALAGASLNTNSQNSRSRQAKEAFEANLDGLSFGTSPQVTVSVDETTVTVAASASVPTAVLGILNIKNLDVAVTSTAIREAGPPICVLALNPAAPKSVNIHGSSAAITAVDCAVHANSSDADMALFGSSSTTSVAGLFCANGGYHGSSFAPTPRSGCPVIRDPYANLPKPLTSGCDYNNFSTETGTETVTLSPGIYCGGLKLKSAAAILQPGIYVIKDGSLNIQANADVKGKGVVFYFYGDRAGMTMSSKAKVELWAPFSGDYAGMVFIQDADSNPGYVNKLSGQSGVLIVGTLYFPTQGLTISGNGDFGADSPYMAIVADTFEFAGNGTMTVQLDEDRAGFDIDIPSSFFGSRLIH